MIRACRLVQCIKCILMLSIFFKNTIHKIMIIIRPQYLSLSMTNCHLRKAVMMFNQRSDPLIGSFVTISKIAALLLSHCKMQLSLVLFLSLKYFYHQHFLQLEQKHKSSFAAISKIAAPRSLSYIENCNYCSCQMQHHFNTYFHTVGIESHM